MNDRDNNNWVKLYRSILDWEWWNEPNTARLFVYCLLKANAEDMLWRGKAIKRGSFITSRAMLSKETGLSERERRTSLQHLEQTGVITIKADKQYTIITLCNYDKYQSLRPIENPTEKPIEVVPTPTPQPPVVVKSKVDNRKQNDMLLFPTEDPAIPFDVKPETTAYNDGIDYDKLMAYWNTMTNGKWGKLTSIQHNRMKMVRARIREHGKKAFVEAIIKASKSDVFAGASWFSFDWMIRPNNFDKVIAGNYNLQMNDGNTTKTRTETTRRTVTKPTGGYETDF